MNTLFLYLEIDTFTCAAAAFASDAHRTNVHRQGNRHFRPHGVLLIFRPEALLSAANATPRVGFESACALPLLEPEFATTIGKSMRELTVDITILIVLTLGRSEVNTSGTSSSKPYQAGPWKEATARPATWLEKSKFTYPQKQGVTNTKPAGHAISFNSVDARMETVASMPM